jgi:hypothetical protein
MEGLLAVSPYVNGPFDSRVKGVAEAVAAAVLSDLNQLANERYMAYLKRSSGNGTARPQLGKTRARKQPAVDADEPAPAAGDQEALRRQPRPTLPLVEATAGCLYSISKAYRPEFDVRRAPERAPDRDCAVPWLHSAVFGNRPRARQQ